MQIFDKFTSSQNDEIEDKAVTSTWEEAYLDLIQVPIGPVIRACVNTFKEVLNGPIQTIWAQSNFWRPIKGIAHDIQATKCMI